MTRRLLCLVTDRRRLADVLNRQHASTKTLLEQIEGAVAGGIDYVQIRERDLDGRDLTRLAVAAVRLCAGTQTKVIVNDRVDVALAAAADGVHLAEASFSSVYARQLLPSALVGRSVHSREGARGAGPVNYVIAGTVFPTLSKSTSGPLLGVEGLSEVVAAARDVAVLAIGGITETHARALIERGVSGVAGIGLFLPPKDCDDIASTVEKIVKNCRFAFDSVSAVP